MQSLLSHFDAIHVIPHQAHGSQPKAPIKQSQILTITPTSKLSSQWSSLINMNHIEKGIIPPTLLIAQYHGSLIQLIQLLNEAVSGEEEDALTFSLEDIHIVPTQQKKSKEEASDDDDDDDSERSLNSKDSNNNGDDWPGLDLTTVRKPTSVREEHHVSNMNRLKLLLRERLQAIHAKPTHMTQTFVFYILMQLHGRVAMPTHHMPSVFSDPTMSANEIFLRSKL